MEKKLIYSDGFKQQALFKVFSRGDKTIRDVAEELNLNRYTLKGWMRMSVSKTEKKTMAKRPIDWSLEERLTALQESHGLSEDALNAWCRKKGLFAHQLVEWKAAFCNQSQQLNHREDALELRTLKADKQRLERELNRKEKALAEAAALLILQKKYQALFEDAVI